MSKMNNLLLFLFFSAAIMMSVTSQGVDYAVQDELNDDSNDDQNMPLSRQERDLSVAESAGIGGGGGGSVGGKVYYN